MVANVGETSKRTSMPFWAKYVGYLSYSIHTVRRKEGEHEYLR
jgi:hypothetical protein